jgi:outer membrane cobalamin receptor
MSRVVVCSIALTVLVGGNVFAAADEPVTTAANETEGKKADGAETSVPLAETSRLSEDLIYSVNRSPQRTFDTSRSVEVITSEEIQRRAGRGLADILADTAGIYVRRFLVSGGSAVVRGLAGNQVLILVDGVKLTNGTWGSTSADYLNLVNVSQIERVEIVRGVVSVLGTESLGGTINIITKKGSPNGDAVTGTVGFRYATADESASVPLTLMGQAGKFRYSAGADHARSE